MIDTLIQWATHTLNFWWGCTKVSPACAHCYAEMMAKLFSRGKATWGPSGARWLRFDAAAKDLAKIVARAKADGIRPRVFVNSMSDTFEDNPLLTDIRLKMLLLFAATPAVDFLLLTKRPENILRMVPMAWIENWPGNVWVGFTGEDQERFDERWSAAKQVPAAVIFCSDEPSLGEVILPSDFLARGNGAWMIIGGESGAGARDFQLEHVLSVVRQCQAAKVPVFVKQFGARPVTSNANLYDFPDHVKLVEHGKAAAGARVLLSDHRHGGDIAEWPVEFQVRQFPEAAA